MLRCLLKDESSGPDDEVILLVFNPATENTFHHFVDGALPLISILSLKYMHMTFSTNVCCCKYDLKREHIIQKKKLIVTR